MDNTLQCQKFLTGLSVRVGDFPRGTMSMTPVYFRRKQKKNETKRTPRLFISPPTHCKYRPDNLKLDVGFFVNQTFTMAFNPSLSKRLSGLVSTLTLQNFSIMMKTFANYNYGDDWAVFLIDVTENPKSYCR